MHAEFAKQRNLTSTKKQLFPNQQKMVPTKRNETTVIHQVED